MMHIVIQYQLTAYRLRTEEGLRDMNNTTSCMNHKLTGTAQLVCCQNALYYHETQIVHCRAPLLSRSIEMNIAIMYNINECIIYTLLYILSELLKPFPKWLQQL